MLVDSFGRTIKYLRVSVTDRCDLRCTYCMPKGFKGFEQPANWLTFAEIERVVAAFARLGTQHFRFTGGEPLLRKNLPQLIQAISQIPQIADLSLTTNGTQLKRYAEELREAGLHRLNVSLDSLRKECVEEITGSNSLPKVLDGLLTAKQAGFSRIKINMVPLAGVNQRDIEQMIEFCIAHDFVLRLIEVMPMGVTGQNLNYVNLLKIIEELKEKYALEKTEQIFGSGPAHYWTSRNSHFALGLITPMSQHFCASCNRVRLSVDGTLYMCLGQDHSYPLRPLLRDHCSDAELEQAIRQAICLKPEAHDFLSQPTKINRLMSMTGG